VSVVSQASGESGATADPVCLACGRPLEIGLQFPSSLRCLECRETGALLDPAVVERWQAEGAEI